MIIEAPAYLLQLTERQYQDLIIEAATANGWMYYHTHDSRRSPVGFPDLVLIKSERPVLYLELKTETGRVAPAQQRWLEVLNAAAGEHVARVVRPSDWPWVAERLAA